MPITARRASPASILSLSSLKPSSVPGGSSHVAIPGYGTFQPITGILVVVDHKYRRFIVTVHMVGSRELQFSLDRYCASLGDLSSRAFLSTSGNRIVMTVPFSGLLNTSICPP